jgi:hypothetical protein
MNTILLENNAASILSSSWAEAEGPVYVVNPSHGIISALVSTLEEADTTSEVRMLADENTLKDIMEDFLVASSAADHVESGRLSIRELPTIPNHSIIVTDDSVYALVAAGDTVGGLGTADDEFVGDATDHYESTWETAEAYSLHTPGISRVRSSLKTEIGETTAADFDAVLASLSTVRGDGDDLNEVMISLLVAARNNELLYDISKWGEDIGLASKATFSRNKTRLEDMGLIDTEKAPIDVGRPRLRLLLGDERLADADIDELATVAQSLLAA